jgi:hypothetical protein
MPITAMPKEAEIAKLIKSSPAQKSTTGTTKASSSNGSAPYQTITLNVPRELLANLDAVIAAVNQNSPRKTNRTEYILVTVHAQVTKDLAKQPKAKKAPRKKK